MKSEFKRILVTAALPYANGFLHLGHLAGAYLPSDIYVRYQRLRKKRVLFLCGSDEHGVAITVTAEQEKVSPKDVIDRYHPAHRKAFEDFGMSFDNYSRTSIPLHHETAKEFFREFHKQGVLLEKREKQLFCEKDKLFLADRYVEGICPNCKYPQARGDQCENCGTWLNQIDLLEPKCRICGTTPVVRETTHWYFPLGKYQDRLEAYIKARDQRDGWKENVLRYCKSWFKAGLEDRAVTRDLAWGVRVPVPGYEDKVIYVWFDAVLGYITSGKEWSQNSGTPDAWRDYWLRDDTKYVAFIGKDNIVFHCIVFPAMLMAWNDFRKEHYVLPENVPANEFLNFEGQKFSKSRGWGIDVADFLKFFPADTLRYTLAINLPESRDSDFYWKDFQARTNNELADILGNFVNRTFAFAARYFENKVPPLGIQSKLDKEMMSQMKGASRIVGDFMDRYKFREATLEAMNLARSANKYFNDSEPWKSVKSNREQCSTTIRICLEVVRSLAILFHPIIPRITARMWTMLNQRDSVESQSWESASLPGLEESHALGESEILVQKVEDSQIEEVIRFLRGADAVSVHTPEEKPMITIDDFKKIDLRVGKVISAEKVHKSDKLLKLRVDIGTESRQIIAGIAKHYAPEKLIGRLVVVVVNLQHAKLMGEESEGMLLAASDNNDKLSIVTLVDELVAGSVVK